MRKAILVAGTILLVCVWGVSANTGRKASPSRLGVVIIVDQMRYDYLPRFASLYSGGLARLKTQGAVFTEAYLDYAATETAVGHATVSTGCLPSHHGIVANEWFDQTSRQYVRAVADSAYPLVGGTAKVGVSPRNMLRPALGDWLKQQSKKSMVYSVSLKDRAAVLLGGQHPDGAFWYDRSTGNYITSKYYMDSLPAVVSSFNAKHLVDSFRATGWNKLVADSVYRFSHDDDFRSENDGVHTKFPHSFDSLKTAKDYYSEFYGTPFADAITLRLAEQIVADRKLGKDKAPDLLFVSLSAADAIGHGYGPNSQEMEDYYLRLDAYLDTFFVFLDSVVGANAYVIAVTADHAVMPLPEDLALVGVKSGRLWIKSIISDAKRIGDTVKVQFGLAANPVAACGYEVILAADSVWKGKATAEQLESALADRMRKLPYMADVFTSVELEDATTPDRKYLRLFRNSYTSARRSDLSLLFLEDYLPTDDPFGTSHGTPYDYDRHVPIVLYGAGVKAMQDSTPVKTIDVAPTVAQLLGIRVPDGVDGSSLIGR